MSFCYQRSAALGFDGLGVSAIVLQGELWRRVKIFYVISQNRFYSVIETFWCAVRARAPDPGVGRGSCRPFRGSGYGADPGTVGFKLRRKPWNPEVDVPVIMQLQFQQSMFYTTTQQHNNTTTQHNTTQHNTTQHNTTQHNTTQHNTTQHNTTTQQQQHRGTDCRHRALRSVA